MRRVLVYFCWLVAVTGCDRGSTPESPTGPNPPAPQPTTAKLSGRVVETTGTSVRPITGALLTISGGMNAGKMTTTNGTGDYAFTALRREGFSISISATGYDATTLTVNLTGDLTRNVTLTPSPPRAPFGNGVFQVGAEIAPGRYFADPPQSGCYWERQRGPGGTFADIIANRFVAFDAAQLVVDILATDVSFKADAKCGTWHDSPRHGLQSSISPGVWLVGWQIAPGTYQTSSLAGCYWERLRHFQYQGVGGVIANSFSAAARTQTITIAAGDIGFNTDGNCGTWTPTSTAAQAPAAATGWKQSMETIERNRLLYEQHTAVTR